MKVKIRSAVIASSLLALSGCQAVIISDGTCGTVSGESHPRFIMTEQLQVDPFSAMVDFPFLLDGNFDHHTDPVYTFNADVTNSFAVRPFLVPTVGELVPGFEGETPNFVPAYLTGDDGPEADTKPKVTVLTTSGPFVDSVSVDYAPFGGALPILGLGIIGDSVPFEVPIPFVLPVDVYSLCAESAEAGSTILYGEGDGEGVLTEDSYFGELENSSFLRTYPAYAGEDFSWLKESNGPYSFEIEPGELDGQTFEVFGVNLAIVPWFEGLGEPTGNLAEDSARAFYTWLALLDELGPGLSDDGLFLSDLEYGEPSERYSLADYPLDPEFWNEKLAAVDWDPEGPFGQIALEQLGPVTNVFAQVMALEGSEEVLSLKYAFYDVSSSAEPTPVPYLGPVVTNDPETAQSGSAVTYTGSDLDEVTSATIAGQTAAIVSKSASSLTLRVPAGLSQGMHDVVLHYSTTESLTLQNGLVVQDLMKVWTQLQSDNTVKMYAKNIIGEGKIQFLHNGNEIAWVRATNALNPKLRQANGSSYLVRTRELVEGKNAFEIYQDGKRIWRAAYAG